MLSQSNKTLSRLAILALALPIAGFSAATTAIEVNGSCDFGNCTAGSLSAGALTVGNVASGSYSFGITLADGDMYTVSGTYTNTFPNGTFLGFFPTVTYTGNSIKGAVAAVAQDTISVDMLQDFYSGGTGVDWSGTYNEKIPLILPVAGSSATGNVSYDGQTVGVLGPVYGSGNYYLTQATPLSGLTGNTLVTDYNLTFTFAGGTATPVGSFASSPSVPEPVETVPVALSLIGLLAFKARKTRAARS